MDPGTAADRRRQVLDQVERAYRGCTAVRWRAPALVAAAPWLAVAGAVAAQRSCGAPMLIRNLLAARPRPTYAHLSASCSNELINTVMG